MGRATQGVTLINVDDGSSLSGVRRVVESDADDDSDLDENGQDAGDEGGDATDSTEPTGNDGPPWNFSAGPSALPRWYCGKPPRKCWTGTAAACR